MAKLAFTFPVFRHAPAVVFGRGSLRSVAEVGDGKTAYLFSAATRVHEYLAETLGRRDIELSAANALKKPAGEPDADAIRMAADFLRGQSFSRIVAVGGGSVLEWARLAWAASVDRLDLQSSRIKPAPEGTSRPQFVLVPTTCGTGAEAADVVVYARDDGAKQSLVSPMFAADRVVLDSRFLDGLPAAQLAGFVCDALSHAVESYLSVVPGPLAKLAAVNALEMIFSAFAEQPEQSQQDRLMEASFLAGVAAANCSVGIVHAFAHTVGAQGVPHGLANAAALETGIRFNAGTVQMRQLLETAPMAGLGGAQALAERVAEISSVALQAGQGYPGLTRLSEPDYRAQIAQGMSMDVTIRSNPRRPTADERRAFVDDVAGRLLG